ncbi:MAG TPA: DUF3341 domain-containing protein [Casimicrobiaceae bacterium]|jgi:hypothetical protein|nr:DUF3341 domain-containing protein [Casimicrobiaceae bacterium]
MLYALLAEFADPRALLDAVRRCRERYHDVDAYAPYAVDGLAEALGVRKNRVPLVTLIGGLVGGAGIYFLQWYSAVVDYPINSGGRPLDSWPVFIPPTFEITILGAALAAFFGMLLLNGLPKLHHPIFNAPEFELASRNRFFVAIRATDPEFDAVRTRAFLEGLAPIKVSEVPL